MSPKKVALIVGASRGIGRQIAIDLARNGYAGKLPPPFSSWIVGLTVNQVVVAAKSTSEASKAKPFPPDPNSPQSTISTVQREIREAGGEATAIAVDTRDYESVQHMVDEAVSIYGGLDVLIYNSGAIWWASIENTPMRRFKLMQRVNAEGLYGTIQAALPHFKNNGWKGRIIVVSPPIYSRFFRGKTAYAMGKVGMSVLTKGLAMDFERDGRAQMSITSIWPATTIFSDAIMTMLDAPPDRVNGHLELDEDFLREYSHIEDFSKYAVVAGATPRRIMPARFPVLEVAEQDDEGRRVDSTKRASAKL
ncbi:MAG: hypothetical protein Q9157_004353 [Trypethelium eluteriae]